MAVPAECEGLSETVYRYSVGTRTLSLAGAAYAEHEGNNSGGCLAAAGHSTGQCQWPSGLLLCDYLASPEGRAQLAGKRVLELGCGLGMCGLAASVLVGPTGRVLLTDGDSRCVARAAANAASNAREGDGAVSTAVLFWGSAADDQALLDSHGGPFHLLLGGDLVYGADAARVKQLMATVDRLLAHTDRATFLLGFQRRGSPLESVLADARARGLHGELLPGDWVVDMFQNRLDECSDFWQLCILRFMRVHEEERGASPPSQDGQTS